MRTSLAIISTAMLVTACDSTGNQPHWTGALQGILGAYTDQSGASTGMLSDAQIVAGLKEALGVGTGNVVSQLAQVGGFTNDSKIHIPLPSELQKVDTALRIAGMNRLTQDLESRMNRAAELATPKAKQLFIHSISQMSFADARTILFSGQQDAATQFFQRTMGGQLISEIKPIIDTMLAEAGAIKAFDAAVGQYQQLPLVGQLTGDMKTNLNSYVSKKAVEGIFYYVAQEEAAIRQNPAKRTTDLLKQVFGATQ